MRIRLRLLVLPVAAAVASALASPAAAAPSSLTNTVKSDNFVVHYSTLAGDAHATTEAKANASLALFEQMRAAFIGWGFTPPANDGDGKLDVWVYDHPAPVLGTASAIPIGEARRYATKISIDVAHVDDRHVIAHELFHAVQFATDSHTASWLHEATAEWAGNLAGGDPWTPFWAPGRPLDCSFSCPGGDDGGYSQWPFFQFATERVSGTFVRELLARAQTLPSSPAPSLNAIESVLADHATSLSQVFREYVIANLSGAYNNATLFGKTARGDAVIETGEVDKAVAPVAVDPVDHLSARYVQFKTGRPSAFSTAACKPAVLRLSVALPAVSAVTPSFYSRIFAQSPTQLTVAAGVAKLDVPWTTCVTSHHGLLSLANITSTTNGLEYDVEYSLEVDETQTLTPPAPGVIAVPAAVPGAPAPVPATPPTTTPTTPTTPTGGPTPGIVEPKRFPPSVEPAPTLRISPPAVTPRGRTLVVSVFSTNSGKAELAIGTLTATAAVRAGGNVVRLKLPAELRGRQVLTVTALSLDGARGTSVRRIVLVPRGR